jgi:HD-GYP domain-containing protein (c-di-GMP phosphodiesterase class II)
MTNKQKVIIGLVSTALAASLAINNILPGWVISIFLLLVGMGFTYYLAINQKRIEQIKDLILLVEAGKRINNEQLVEKEKMLQTYRTTLISIARAVEKQENGFEGHAERVAAVSLLIGKKLGLQEHEINVLEYSALLHDIGKLAVSAEISEGDNDSGNEYYGLEQHPVLGGEFFPDNDFFTPIKEGILYHHERYNGTGYPEGLEKNEIPFSARIIAVADFYDALTRLCPEEERLNHYNAIRVVKKATGTLFDPLVVVAFGEVEEDIRVISLSQQL